MEKYTTSEYNGLIPNGMSALLDILQTMILVARRQVFGSGVQFKTCYNLLIGEMGNVVDQQGDGCTDIACPAPAKELDVEGNLNDFLYVRASAYTKATRYLRPFRMYLLPVVWSAFGQAGAIA